MNQAILQRGLDQALATKSSDEELLKEALHLLEFATYHDGRYGQLNFEEWQDKSIQLEKKICSRLRVERYASLGVKKA